MDRRPASLVDRPRAVPRETQAQPQRRWLFRVLRSDAKAPAVSSAGAALAGDADPLSDFSTEGEGARPAPQKVETAPASTNRGLLIVVLSVAIGAALAVVGVQQYRALAARTPSAEPGKLLLDSSPAGAKVLIDGEERGLTPLGVSLRPGTHAVTLVTASGQRDFPVTIVAGGTVSQFFEFAAAPTLRAGRLAVTADVPGSRVSVDGHARGSTPLVLSDLAVGEHTVTVAGEGGSLERKVTIEAGATASLVFSLPKATGPAAGWLQINAPFDVQAYEGPDLVGSGAASKIMLPAGRHEIRIVSQGLGYEDTKRVEIAAGKVAPIKIDAPKAIVSANARPWADVIIDGVNAGQTPLANLQVAIGSHEVVFRHPQLGEQKQTVVVTVKGPNRISADLTRK